MSAFFRYCPRFVGLTDLEAEQKSCLFTLGKVCISRIAINELAKAIQFMLYLGRLFLPVLYFSLHIHNNFP